MGHQRDNVSDGAAADGKDEGIRDRRVILGVFAGAPALTVHEDQSRKVSRVAGLFNPFAIESARKHLAR